MNYILRFAKQFIVNSHIYGMTYSVFYQPGTLSQNQPHTNICQFATSFDDWIDYLGYKSRKLTRVNAFAIQLGNKKGFYDEFGCWLAVPRFFWQKMRQKC